MKNLNEMDFTTLRNNFDEVCYKINSGNEAMALNLKSGRTVYVMPEENYNNISRFVIVNTSKNALTH